MNRQDDIRRLMRHVGGSPEAYREFDDTARSRQASRWALLQAVFEAGAGSVPAPSLASRPAAPEAAPSPPWTPPPAATGSRWSEATSGASPRPPAVATPAPAVEPISMAALAMAVAPEEAVPARSVRPLASPAPLAQPAARPTTDPVSPAGANSFARIFRSAPAEAASVEASPPEGSLKALLQGIGTCR